MDDVFLVGAVDGHLLYALRQRGLRLTTVRHPACRVALIVGAAGAQAMTDQDVSWFALVRGDAALIAALDGGAADAADDRSTAAVIAARLAALVRRTRNILPLDYAPLAYGDLVMDRVGRRVIRAGRPIMLLPREYMLLLFLMQHAGSVVPRARLREAVWGLDFDPGTNVIEVHVSRLRAKLDRGFAEPMVETVRGVGYRLIATPRAQSAIAAAIAAV